MTSHDEHVIKIARRLLSSYSAWGMYEYADYEALKNILQKEKNASARAAQEIIGFLQANA